MRFQFSIFKAIFLLILFSCYSIFQILFDKAYRIQYQEATNAQFLDPSITNQLAVDASNVLMNWHIFGLWIICLLTIITIFSCFKVKENA